EDGIRDFHVTGVQTCALPMFDRAGYRFRLPGRRVWAVLRAGFIRIVDTDVGLLDRLHAGNPGREANPVLREFCGQSLRDNGYRRAEERRVWREDNAASSVTSE